MNEVQTTGATSDRRAVWGGVALIAIVVVAWATGALHALSFESLQSSRVGILAWVDRSPGASMAAFFTLYVVVAALSLPGAAPLTLLGGTLFGFGGGLVVVSMASTVGATLACALGRWLFADAIGRRFPGPVAAMNRGLAEDGIAWLFAARLVPAFPFFVVNLVLGVSRVPLRTFFWTSQLGMLPGTAVYVWAGTQLAELTSPRDILSPGLWGAMALLGVFPIAARRATAWWRSRRAVAAAVS